MKKIGELANKYEALLTKKEKLYLPNFSFSATYFYGLPKFHKSKQANEVIQQQNNEYREINETDDLTVRPIIGDQTVPRDI